MEELRLSWGISKHLKSWKSELFTHVQLKRAIWLFAAAAAAEAAAAEAARV